LKFLRFFSLLGWKMKIILLDQIQGRFRPNDARQHRRDEEHSAVRTRRVDGGVLASPSSDFGLAFFGCVARRAFR